MDEQRNIMSELEDEISAILALYDPEIEEYQKLDGDPSGKIYELKLKLGPHSADMDSPTVNMHATIIINIYKGYPARKAEIRLDSIGGISPDQQTSLMQAVTKVSSEKAASEAVAVSDICNCVQDILTMYADEQIADKEAKKLEKEEQARKELEEEEQKERNFLERKRSVDLAVREEAKMKREQQRERSVSLNETVDLNEKYNQMFEILKEKAVPIAFKCKHGNGLCDPTLPLTVELGSINIVLDEMLKNKTEKHMHVYLAYEQHTRTNLIVYKWAVHINLKRIDDEKVDAFMNTIKSLEAEANLLMKQKHENLAVFKGMKWLRNGNRCINLFLIYECVRGLSLSYHINKRVSLSEPMLRHTAEAVLNALDYLHNKTIVHRNIRPSSICFDQFSQNVRLSDYGLKIRCIEAVAEYYDQEIPQPYTTYPGRSKKSSDIHRFGYVLLQLYNAKKGRHVFIKPNGKLTVKFSSFLTCCIEIPSNGERWSADELLAHKFITDDDDSSTAYGLDANGMPWIPDNLKSDSRLYKDYDCLYILGKGGFGSVYKVQSKVEGNMYALKIIKVIKEDTIQSRKMILEVKVLSSLNHENVVRYYTSWKETLSEMLRVTPLEENMSQKDRAQSQQKVTIEDSSSPQVDTCDTDDEELQETSLSNICGNDEEDDDSLIEFEEPSNPNQEIEEPIKKTKRKTKEAELSFSYLYIQMELCEKNTLRQAIDKWKHSRDDVRLWRLFREMVNGLDYIHIKGLIHRDLKPGNIFIDSNDRVKIGDFGLAAVIVDRTTVRTDAPSKPRGRNSAYLTGRVGTTYYIAPEIKGSECKVKYSSKVDMYSLGIILFEMVYSFDTAMERDKILTNLKLETPVYPKDYEMLVDGTKRTLIQMLLNKDPSNRPNTRDLLDSSLLPPLPAEQQKFISMMKEAIAKEGSARYKDMLQLIFNQVPDSNIEATFEAGHQRQLKNDQLQDVDYVYCSIVDVFRKHGGIWIQTPFFTPKGACYVEPDKCANFLTKDGDLISSQYDLRYPFARFLAKGEIKPLKRFYIDKIHKSINTASVHPHENYECAFDIVDNRTHLVESMVRLLLVTQEVLLEVCGFHASEVVIKLSHMDLVKMMLIQANIEPCYHKRVISVLNDSHRKVCGFDEKSLIDCISKITKDTLSVDILKIILSLSGSVSDVLAAITARSLLPKIGKHKSMFAEVSKQLEDIVSFSKEMGVQIAFDLQPLMVADDVLYNGMAVRLQTVTNHRKGTYKVLANGGSYYHLVSRHKKKIYMKQNSSAELCAVGISLAFTRLVGAFQNRGHKKCLKKSTITEVLVCSIEKRQIKRRMEWVNVLLDLGLSVDHCYMESMNEDALYYNKFRHVENYLFLEVQDESKYTVKSVEIEDSQTKVALKYLSTDEVLEYFTKIARPYAASDSSNLNSSRRESSGKSVKAGPRRYEFAIEFICRKPLRDKEDKIKQKISEEVDNYITSKFGSCTITGKVDIVAVDFDKTFVSSLRELDLDSTLKNFNDSLAELKLSCRDSEVKEYIDKISKFCVKKVFHGRKHERPFATLAYSIPSEYLRRIY